MSDITRTPDAKSITQYPDYIRGTLVTKTIDINNVTTVSETPLPPEEINSHDLRSKAKAALASNATFLALPSPSNLQIADQVKKLTRQTNALIKLNINELDDTSGT